MPFLPESWIAKAEALKVFYKNHKKLTKSGKPTTGVMIQRTLYLIRKEGGLPFHPSYFKVFLKTKKESPTKYSISKRKKLDQNIWLNPVKAGCTWYKDDEDWSKEATIVGDEAFLKWLSGLFGDKAPFIFRLVWETEPIPAEASEREKLMAA